MTGSERPALAARVPATPSPDDILDAFLGWLGEAGLTPYPEQEAAFLEILEGRHVVLQTPTGSGKSLVALMLQFKAFCEGERSFYTAPTKALVSEKFFALCGDFGAEHTGMLTGDASINRDAPVMCCTTEILANMALREGEAARAPYAVLDEFHYYADRDRGAAWEIPLIALPHTQFLLMSATLGNTAPIEEKLEERSGRAVVHIHSDERPVPLDFEYRETPLHETLEVLVERGEAPIYVVNFTQRECGEQAQGLTSSQLSSREEKRAVAEAIAGFRFDTAYGRDVQRFLRHAIGIHHAGLLPKYRLLVEQLAQRGLLKVICGTDTLGVGVNVPIRTVVFSRLCKFDGEKVGILSVREFKQIAGRAGRKGFDDRGRVVCQAPEHVIENKRLAERAAAGGKRKPAKRKAPGRGFVPWGRDTFERLVERPPEPLESRFDVNHGMVVLVLQRELVGPRGGYGELAMLIDRSHVRPGVRPRLRRHLAALFRSLRRAGVVEVVPGARGSRVRVAAHLQRDFSLHETLSLYLVEASAALDPEAPAYPLELTSLVEAILENPMPILLEQASRRKGELLAQLKAEGVPYEERIQKLEEVSWPRPEEEFIRASFALFARSHPWVGEEDIRPKSVAREMFEGCAGFVEYVRDYGIARSEGLLLRYLSQVHNALVKTVPASARTEGVIDVIAYLRALLQGVDTSLIDAWEGLAAGAPPEAGAVPAPQARSFDLAAQPGALAARVRAELHALVRALAAGDFEQAARCVRADPDDPWDAARFEEALAPFFEEYERLVFTPQARQAHHTHLKAAGPRRWDVQQVLVDPAGDDLWAISGEVDLRRERDPEGPLVRIRRIGT